MTIEEGKTFGSTLRYVIAILLVFLGLILVSLYNYLLFHSLAEMFSIVVGFGIFMIAWNSRRFSNNDFVLMLGISFFFVAVLDLVHTLSYWGMEIFQGYDANLSLKFWLSARIFQSLSLLAAPYFLSRRLNVRWTFFFYIVMVVVVIAASFARDFIPPLYISDVGLTAFKKYVEYIVGFALLGALFYIRKRRSLLDPRVFRFLSLSIFSAIASELVFTMYFHATDLVNWIGHFFKILSFLFIYIAIIETGLRYPYLLLFRDLKRRERELEKALGEVRRLSGMLPICASCKKIRDDQGYWQQVEVYIKEHSDVDFSHSICPDCQKKLYPELKQNS